MENEQLISLRQFCSFYNVESTFIETLTEFGLIEIHTVEEIPYVSKDHIGEIEKLIRLHYDLEINMEGIDVIKHLLEKVNNMQAEINALKNRLSIYEGG